MAFPLLSDGFVIVVNFSVFVFKTVEKVACISVIAVSCFSFPLFSFLFVFFGLDGKEPAEDEVVDDGVDEPDEKLEEKDADKEYDV